MKQAPRRAGAVVAAAAAALALAGAAARADVREDQPTPIARGPHISGVVHALPHLPGAAVAAAPSTCSTPGSTNYKTNCHGSGRPVNETWIAPNPLGSY